MRIGAPPSWRKALRVLEETNGVAISVSDEEIFTAKVVIDRSGIGCEPASAASLAGLKQLVAAGVIHREQSVICLLTGHMLKDAESLELYWNDGMDAE